MKKPRKCPPIIRFGSAAILFGIAKTINAVAPMLAMINGLLDKVNVIKKQWQQHKNFELNIFSNV